jgi:acetylornithine aminotransferase
LESGRRSSTGQALNAGLLINVTAERVIRLLPPLILDAPEAEQIVQVLGELIQGFPGNV